MLKLNGCKRCGGDLVIDKDNYGWYEECVQCGFILDLQEVPGLVPVRVVTFAPKDIKYENPDADWGEG